MVDLFEPYPVTGQDIRDAGNATRWRVSRVRDVTAGLEAQHRGAAQAVEGQLLDSVINAPTEAITQADELNRKAEFAAGCLEWFGLAVDDFNIGRTLYPRSVSRLNADWEAAVEANFGLDYDDIVSDDNPQARQQDSIDDYADLLAAARTRTIARLQKEYGAGEQLLDDAASDVETMLAAGPVEEHVQTLWAAGTLPFYAPLVFTDSDLTNTPTTPAVARSLEAHLDELETYRDDPEAEPRENMYLQVLQSTVVEPPPPQEEIDESIRLLREAGMLEQDEVPDDYYLSWLTWSLRKGLGPGDIVERAQQEEVSMERFDELRELESIQAPDGRRYFLLQDDKGAKDVARLTELFHGGTPSITDNRRSNNEWTYDGRGIGDSYVESELNAGGAIVATPEGTMMVAPGPDGAVRPVDGSGTTWMEMYVLNASYDDPESALREMIESGQEGDGDSLAQKLLHERLHTAQWGEYGYLGFGARYGWEFLSQGNAGDCGNDYETEAVADWGGYEECTPWGTD